MDNGIVQAYIPLATAVIALTTALVPYFFKKSGQVGSALPTYFFKKLTS